MTYPTCVPTARYTLTVAFPLYSIHTVTKLQPVTLKEQGIKLPEGLLILSRTAHSLKLHIHPHNTYDAEGMRELLERKFLLPKVCVCVCLHTAWLVTGWLCSLNLFNVYLVLVCYVFSHSMYTHTPCDRNVRFQWFKCRYTFFVMMCSIPYMVLSSQNLLLMDHIMSMHACNNQITCTYLNVFLILVVQCWLIIYSCICLQPLHEVFAFQYYAAIHHPNPTFVGNRSLPSFFKLTGGWRVVRLGSPFVVKDCCI